MKGKKSIIDYNIYTTLNIHIYFKRKLNSLFNKFLYEADSPFNGLC